MIFFVLFSFFCSFFFRQFGLSMTTTTTTKRRKTRRRASHANVEQEESLWFLFFSFFFLKIFKVFPLWHQQVAAQQQAELHDQFAKEPIENRNRLGQVDRNRFKEKSNFSCFFFRCFVFCSSFSSLH